MEGSPGFNENRFVMKRRIAILVVGAVLAAAAFCMILSRDRGEPVYQGKTASSWLAQFRKGNIVQPGRRITFKVEAEDAFRSMGPAAVPYLAKAIESRESAGHKFHAAMLRWMPRSLKRRFPFYPDQSGDVRTTALIMLGELGPAARAAIPALLRCLKQGDPNLRHTALVSLARVGAGDPRCRAALLHGLQDPHDDIRVSAAMFLENNPPLDPQDVPKLVACLEDRDARVRGPAARMLGTIGPPAQAALGALLRRAENDEDTLIRAHAAYSAWLIDPARLPVTLGVLETGARSGDSRSCFLLGRLGPAAAPAVPALVGILNDPTSPVLMEAGAALGNIGPQARAALPALKGLCQAAEDPHLRLHWAVQIVKIDSSETNFWPLLRETLHGENDWDRILAAHTLWTLHQPAPDLIPGLVTLIENRDGDRPLFARLAAVDLLGEMGGQAAGALPVLRAATTNDPNPDIRVRAQAAVRSVEDSRGLSPPAR